jgi:hypothetical protein
MILLIEIFHNGVGSFFAQEQIIFGGSCAVGVPLDFQIDAPLVGNEFLDKTVQGGFGLRAQLVAVELKL